MKGLLVGYGSIGRRHLANFAEQGVGDWAVVHTGRGTLAFDPPCDVASYSSLSEALDRERPDFAIVANPTNLHVATALACANAGCHLLLEKPVSDRMDGLAELKSVVAERAVRVLVGFQFRFHPALRRIQALLRDGTIGVPLHGRAVWGEHLPSWHPWEDWHVGYAARPDLGGGVHHTICHPIDYLRMLFGDPVGVSAMLTTDGHLGLDVAEAADVLLRFGGGATAQFHLDYWSQPAVHRLEVLGSRGSVEWDYIQGTFRIWDNDAGSWRSESYPGVPERNGLFQAETKHFLDVVSGRENPICTLDDGIDAVRLCVAIEQSASR